MTARYPDFWVGAERQGTHTLGTGLRSFSGPNRGDAKLLLELVLLAFLQRWSWVTSRLNTATCTLTIVCYYTLCCVNNAIIALTKSASIYIHIIKYYNIIKFDFKDLECLRFFHHTSYFLYISINMSHEK